MLKAKPQFVAFAPIDLKETFMYIRDGFDNGDQTPTTTDIEAIGTTAIALSDCGLNVPDGACVTFGNEPDEEYTVASATRTGGTDTIFHADPGTATAGTFTLTFRGEVTEPIAYDAAAATVELALEALCNVPVGEGTVAAAGTPPPDWIITFSGTLGDQPLTITDDLTLQDYTDNQDAVLTIDTPGVAPTATTDLVITPGVLTATTAGGLVHFKGRKIEIVIGEGNANYKETYNREYRKNRGLLNTVRNADQEPLELSFDFEWDYISSVCGAAVPTIEEALKGTGPAADWVSSADDECEPKSVIIEIWNVPACSTTNAKEKFVFADFRVEALDHNINDSQVSASGKCNILEPEIHRYT